MAIAENEPKLVSDDADAHSLDGYYSDTPVEFNPKYPTLEKSFDSVIIVLNLPKVSQNKIEKLTKVVAKLVQRIGNLATSGEADYNGMLLPFDETTNQTSGFAFVEYEDPEDAQRAVEVLKNYKFDKNHILQVIPYGKGKELGEVPSEFTEPEPAPFVEKPNTSSWMEDHNQRDQFVIRQGKETIVHWNDARNDPVVDYDGEREKLAGTNWCEYYVQWSPRGSYLATLVRAKGVILWGGANYEKIARFPSPHVQFVLFSPEENYLLTSNNDRNDPAAIKIFNIQTGKQMRAFPLYPPDFLDNPSSAQSTPPPPFLWSHDDKYLARMGKDLISIYETPHMRLLDRRSQSTPGIHEFQWSPKANIITYWAPEVGNSPAHVDLIEIPSRKKLRQKNLFNVTKCSMVWQSSGEYLSVKVTRHTKSKKTFYNNMELFRINEPGIPVEMLDIKDAVMAFAWEPKGSRFAMIHAENPTSTKVNVSFYDMNKKVEPTITKKKKGNVNTGPSIVPELNKGEALEGKQCNCIFWSPAGGIIIMAGLGDSASGTLEFYDVDEKKLIATKDHYRANAVLWDHSGRTVATTVSQPIEGGHFKFAMDNGYILWTFQGKQLYQQSFETFYQLQWRPRPQFLSKSEEKKVIKNLKKYEKVFDRADRERTRALRLEETKEKRALRAKFRDTMARLRGFRDEQKAERMALRDGYDSEDEDNYVTIEVTLESIVSSKEDVMV